jgi:hypothetical protein
VKKIALDHRVAQDAVNLGLNFALTAAEAIHAASAIVGQSGRAPAMGAKRGARKDKSVRASRGAANAYVRRYSPATIERQFLRKSLPLESRRRQIDLK